MGTSETKKILRAFRIVPNKLLGQNFTVEPSVFDKLVQYAHLSKRDVVLEIGAGFGFLTDFMSKKCKRVLAVEKDPQVEDVLLKRCRHLSNVDVILGDVLKVALPEFNKVVSVPPYYLSSNLVVWLLSQKVDCAVWVLQREFADRLVAISGSDAYSWLSVIAYHSMEVELLDAVPKDSFFPQPEVDSVIMRLTPWKETPFKVLDTCFFFRMVKWLFTERNKKLRNAIVPFIKAERQVATDEAERLADSLLCKEMRVRALSPATFGVIANALAC